MRRKELTKTSMMISNFKKFVWPLGLYEIFQLFKSQGHKLKKHNVITDGVLTLASVTDVGFKVKTPMNQRFVFAS